MVTILKSGSIEEYRANVESMNHFVPDELREKLRALRLWHWRECVRLRAEAGLSPEDLDPRYKEISQAKRVRLDREANFHIKQVQMLNEFFEAGDTAEKDAA